MDRPSCSTYKYECPNCSKGFKRKGDMNRHMQLHLGFKPYECPHCGKCFAQRSGLNTHINTHTKAKPYKCGIFGCTREFGDPSSCTRHRKEFHRRTGVFKCPVENCPSRIKRRSAFAKHLKTHGWDLPSKVISTFYEEHTPGRRSSLAYRHYTGIIEQDRPAGFVQPQPIPPVYVGHPSAAQYVQNNNVQYPTHYPYVLPQQSQAAPTTDQARMMAYEIQQMENALLYYQQALAEPAEAVPTFNMDGLLQMEPASGSSDSTPAMPSIQLPVASTSTQAINEPGPSTPPRRPKLRSYPATPEFTFSPTSTPSSTPASILATPQFSPGAVPAARLEAGKILFPEFQSTSNDYVDDDEEWFRGAMARVPSFPRIG